MNEICTAVAEAIEDRQPEGDVVTNMEADNHLLDENSKIEFAVSGSVCTSPGNWKNTFCTVAEFIEMLTFSKEGEKDGTCFTQGSLLDGIRDHDHIISSHIMVFDLSNGTTAKEIDEKLAKSGYAYVRHSTYGHLASQTTIRLNQYTGFKNKQKVTEKDVKDYLRKKRGFSKDLLEKAELRIDEDIVVLSHEPLEKHHLILFLRTPFVFHGKGVDNKAAQKLWRRSYKKLGKKLGLRISHNCEDPAHTFYFPRHAKGITPDSLFKSGKTVSLPEGKVKRPLKQADGKEGSQAMDVMAELAALSKKYSFVTVGSEGRIVRKNADNTYSFLKKQAFFDLYANQIVELPRRNETTIARLWFKSKYRQSYERVVFDPSGKAGDDALNLWCGFPVTPKKGDWSLLRNHIKDNICQGDEKNFEWLLAWIAQIFQEPAKKLGTSVVLGGEKGTGKSKLAEWLSFLLGTHASTVSQAQHVTGNFNAHLEQCLLLVAEEAFWAGSKQDEGALKHLITGKTMTLERKGIDPVQIDNFTRLLTISNNDWIVPATIEERRFFVLEVGTRQQKNGRYFAAIDKQMENGGAEAMLHDLLELDISGVDLRNPPRTQWLANQIEEGLTDVQAWVKEMLTDGQLPLYPSSSSHGLYSSDEDDQPALFDEPGPETTIAIPCSKVYRSYVNFCQTTRFHKPACNAKFGKELKKLIPDLSKIRETDERIGTPEKSKRVYKYEFPDLSSMRAYFQHKTGLVFEEVIDADAKRKEADRQKDELQAIEELQDDQSLPFAIEQKLPLDM